jgi:hypothetical protein
MSRLPGRHGGLPLLGAGLAAIVGIVGLLLAVRAYNADAGGRSAPATTHYRTVEAALRARLSHQYLAYRWVKCTTMPQRFKGIQVSRCNVNFGDPHIVPYCAVLVGGLLITDRENQAVDCGSRVTADEQGKNLIPGD